MRLSTAFLASFLACATVGASASPVIITFRTLTGANDSAFIGYTQPGTGFTVSALPLNNTWEVAATGPETIGYPLPDIFTNTTGSILITDGGGLFNFTSVDLGFFTAGTISYNVIGRNGSAVEFTQTGTLSDLASGFKTLNSSYTSTDITNLEITIGSTDTLGSNIDNIDLSVAATPEPSSIALLGTGILGMAGLLRRRRTA